MYFVNIFYEKYHAFVASYLVENYLGRVGILELKQVDD